MMKKYRLINYPLVMIFVALFSGCTSHAQLGSDTLRIGVRADVPLVGYYDFNVNRAGSEIKLARNIAAFIGKKPKLITVTSNDREERLINGDVDMVIATFSITKQRAKHLAFSKSYKTDHQGVMVKSDAPFHAIADLKGKKIGFVKGATSMHALMTQQPGITPVMFDDYYRAMFAFSLGDIDGLSTDKSILMGLNTLWSTRQKKLANIDGDLTFLINVPGTKSVSLFRLLKENLSDERYAVAVKKSNKALLKKINKFLKNKISGT